MSGVNIVGQWPSLLKSNACGLVMIPIFQTNSSIVLVIELLLVPHRNMCHILRY